MADLTKEFVEKIEELIDRDKIVTDSFGREYSPLQLYRLGEPQRTEIDVSTLTGFSEYINDVHQDDIKPGDFIHIAGPSLVCFMGAPDSYEKRTTYSVGRPEGNSFRFGSYYSVEEFIIAIQVHFVQDKTTAKLMQIVGNIVDNKIAAYSDDGVSQSVTAKIGITRVESVALPNPVKLAPYRTFPELDQPYSPYVFRMQQKGDAPPVCALFSVGDVRWQLEATEKIKGWLSAAIKKAIPIIG